MIAAGVVHESERFTNRDNVVVAPAYTRLDASSTWELPGRRLTLGMVVENVTDLRYVRSAPEACSSPGLRGVLAVQMSSSF